MSAVRDQNVAATLEEMRKRRPETTPVEAQSLDFLISAMGMVHTLMKHGQWTQLSDHRDMFEVINEWMLKTYGFQVSFREPERKPRKRRVA